MEGVAEKLGDATTVLLLGSPMAECGDAVCVDLLLRGEQSPRQVLNVLFTRRPNRHVEIWKHHAGSLPETFVVLASQQPSEAIDGVEIEGVGQPGDLTGIGVAITEYLTEWPSDEPTAFCLHSVTAQLQFAEPEQVYQFHHTLCGHLAELGVVGHVHMNPMVHDTQTVDTFKTLFDAVVEVDDDGATVATQRW